MNIVVFPDLERLRTIINQNNVTHFSVYFMSARSDATSIPFQNIGLMLLSYHLSLSSGLALPHFLY